MKKVLFCMFALLTSASMVSCNQKQEAANAAADSTKQEVAQPAPAAEEAPSLATIVEKMEKEGANWNEEQWKEQMKNALLAMKPTMVKMEELMKKMESSPEALAEAAAELEKISNSDEGKKFEELTDKMEKLIDANPVAKKLYADDGWLKDFAKENGIPDL